MYRQQETNPHFYPLQLPEYQNQPPQPQHGRQLRFPMQPSQPRPQHQSPEIILQPPQLRPNHKPPKTQQSSDHHLSPPFQSPRHSQPSRPQHHPSLNLPTMAHPPPSNQNTRPLHQTPSHRITKSRNTKPITWMIAALCALFWITIILGGLIVLIFYLLFRPRLPKFDVSSTSLNAAYLDLGYLLNADVNLLANFTNPNKKVNVDFSNNVIDLYTQGSLIATRYIEPFSVMRADYKLTNVHMVSSQVMLSPQQSQQLRRQTDSGRVEFVLKGVFRTRSNLGFLRYSYWLYAHCRIVVSGPPSGVIVRKNCVTKR